MRGWKRGNLLLCNGAGLLVCNMRRKGSLK